MEARPLNSEVLTRRCVLARLQDLTVDRFRELIAQGAGAVLILLPRNMSHVLQQSVEVSAKYNSLASDFQKEKILEEIHKNIPECTFSLKEKEGRRGGGGYRKCISLVGCQRCTLHITKLFWIYFLNTELAVIKCILSRKSPTLEYITLFIQFQNWRNQMAI